MGISMYLFHRNTFLMRQGNILPMKCTSELYEFIHRKGYIDITISRRAANVKALRLSGPAPKNSSPVFCVGI